MENLSPTEQAKNSESKRINYQAEKSTHKFLKHHIQ